MDCGVLKGGRGNGTAAGLHSSQECTLILLEKEREEENNRYIESLENI